MKPHLFNLCPESELYIPKHGKSAFVRACIIDVGRRMSKSKGLPAPASVEPVLVPPVAPVVVEPVFAPPASVEPAEPVVWQRSWSKPPREFPDGFDYTSLIWDKARKIFLNPPPWPAVPSLDMEQARSWYEYTANWRYPDPFPGPLEWHAMGEPAEPLPGHRAIVEPLPVEPSPDVVLAPSQECPPAAAELPVAGMSLVEPLPVVGVSINSVLEEV